ncbi:MAG: bifunctional oligoribonuclease/PAP phosphatase NrnA [Deltaproteobacteria bacterium]
MVKKFSAVIEEIKKGKRFLVVSHVNPEGDAVGSLLGLALALRSTGKEVVAFLEDPVPDVFGFLPGADTVVHDLSGQRGFDATFAVDCGQKERLGKGFMNLRNPGIVINIDHHATNDCFGDINVVVDDASAAGELVYDLCVEAGIKITKDMAVNLYVAIHTDTGSFRYSSSTPGAFAKAGELVRLGADPWEVSRRVYENYPAKKFKLLGMVLSTLEIVQAGDGASGGKIASVIVSLDMLNNAGADKDTADGFVNYARGIEGVEVGVLLRECANHECKVSLRSTGDVDVSRVASSFGGGGHHNAAGFNVKGTLDEVSSSVIDAIKQEMRRGNRAINGRRDYC